MEIEVKTKYKIVLGIGGLQLIHIFFIFTQLNLTTSQFQFPLEVNHQLIAGIDGISLWLIFLTQFITNVVVLNGWRTSKDEQFLYTILIINLISLLIFLFLDILLFYIAFEAILIPMYYLIAYYGSRNRKTDAINYFLIYTIIGS